MMALVPAPEAPPLKPPAAVSAPPAATRYGFASAFLGETIAEWRAGPPGRAAASCIPAGGEALRVSCFGPDVALGGGYRARNLHYDFVQDRLAAISFTTSVDGFDFVTADFKGRFGPPDRIVRDKVGRLGFPHVSVTWKNGRSTIVLSDPLPDYTHMSVRLIYGPLADRLPKSGPERGEPL